MNLSLTCLRLLRFAWSGALQVEFLEGHPTLGACQVPILYDLLLCRLHCWSIQLLLRTARGVEVHMNLSLTCLRLLRFARGGG